MSKEHPYKDTAIYKIIMKIFEYKTVAKLSAIEINVLKTLPKVLYEKDQELKELNQKYIDSLNNVVPESRYIYGCLQQFQMSEYLELDKHCLVKWCNNPDLKVPFRVFKGRKYFDKDEMDAWLLSQPPGFAVAKYKGIHLDEKKKEE